MVLVVQSLFGFWGSKKLIDLKMHPQNCPCVISIMYVEPSTFDLMSPQVC